MHSEVPCGSHTDNVTLQLELTALHHWGRVTDKADGDALWGFYQRKNTVEWNKKIRIKWGFKGDDSERTKKLFRHTVESEVYSFVACSYSWKRSETNRPRFPVFTGVGAPASIVSLIPVQNFPVYLFDISCAIGCRFARCGLGRSLEWYHHPVWSNFDRAFWCGVCGAWSEEEEVIKMLFQSKSIHIHYGDTTFPRPGLRLNGVEEPHICKTMKANVCVWGGGGVGGV